MRSKIVIFVLIASMLIFSVAPVFAGAILVSDFDDAGTNCTLREAVAEANAVGAGGGTLGNGCTGASAGSNTINLPPGIYTLASELPAVTTTIIIQPSSGIATIQANASANTATYRVIRVTSATGNLTLDGLIIRNGGNSGSSIDGGCLRVETSGTLTINNTTVEQCYGRFGGGVGVLSATLNVTGGSIIRNNQVSRDGGGIDTQNAAVSISNSTIINNVNANTASNAAGGGITAFSPISFSMSGTTVSNNSVGSAAGGVGGGLYFSSFSGVIGSITGSVFVSNRATGAGTNRGGAIYHVGADALNIGTSRFESNTSDDVGDAIYHAATATMIITSSCFTNNGDTAVYDTATTSTVNAGGGGNIALSNWWGTSWGPRITGVASGTSSYTSNGDSINGNGATVVSDVLVDVHLTTNPTDMSGPSTGAWLTTAPVVAGATCQTCSSVSGAGSPRACYS